MRLRTLDESLTPLQPTFREPVRPWTGWARKIRTLGSVAGALRRPPAPEVLADKARALCGLAAAKEALPEKIATLWRIESLVFATADEQPEAIRLGELEMPGEAGPPAHCGLAMAAVMRIGLDPERLTAYLRAHADPRFIDFAFETLGLMLALHERDAFGRITALLGRVGLLRRSQLEDMPKEAFLEALPEEWRAYASHGYGRLLYFKSHGLRGAILGMRKRPFLSFGAAVKGAVAAYVLINGRDIEAILALADSTQAPEIGEPMAGGLRNVTQLLEWSMPGCLGDVTPSGGRAAQLLGESAREASARRRRGAGPGLEA